MVEIHADKKDTKSRKLGKYTIRLHAIIDCTLLFGFVYFKINLHLTSDFSFCIVFFLDKTTHTRNKKEKQREKIGNTKQTDKWKRMKQESL